MVWSLWRGAERVERAGASEVEVDAQIECDLWNEQCQVLTDRVDTLQSSKLPKEVRAVKRSEQIGMSKAAGRIQEFLDAIQSPEGQQIRMCWMRWMANRRTARAALFGAQNRPNPQLLKRLRQIYKSRYQVRVLLGGPPAKGLAERVGERLPT